MGTQKSKVKAQEETPRDKAMNARLERLQKRSEAEANVKTLKVAAKRRKFFDAL